MRCAQTSTIWSRSSLSAASPGTMIQRTLARKRARAGLEMRVHDAKTRRALLQLAPASFRARTPKSGGRSSE
jgi:hypothetical protein